MNPKTLKPQDERSRMTNFRECLLLALAYQDATDQLEEIQRDFERLWQQYPDRDERMLKELFKGRRPV